MPVSESNRSPCADRRSAGSAIASCSSAAEPAYRSRQPEPSWVAMVPTSATLPSIRSFIRRTSPMVSISWSKRFSASATRLAVFETSVAIWAICRMDPMIALAWGAAASSSAAHAAAPRIRLLFRNFA